MLNLSSLEKLSNEELLKLNEEYSKAITDNTTFLNNFDLHIENFKSCYFVLERKVKDINIFFKSNFRLDAIENGLLFKSIERHLVFDHNTKLQWESMLNDIIETYHRLLTLNYNTFPAISIGRTSFISDKIFNCNRKSYASEFHLFDFEIETLTGSSGRFPGQGTEIFNLEGLGSYKSLSYPLNIPADIKNIDLPREIAEKSIYEKDINIKNSNHEKRLRKIELILRARKKGKEKIENTGYVYVLSNEAYKNIYKIGSTYGIPEERAEELTGTGHLTPFKVELSIEIKSAEFYEKKIHSLLNSYRVKQNREFFELDLDKIKNCLKQVSVISEKGLKEISLTDLKKEIRL
jgi:hypothetical protein